MYTRYQIKQPVFIYQCLDLEFFISLYHLYHFPILRSNMFLSVLKIYVTAFKYISYEINNEDTKFSARSSQWTHIDFRRVRHKTRSSTFTQDTQLGDDVYIFRLTMRDLFNGRESGNGIRTWHSWEPFRSACFFFFHRIYAYPIRHLKNGRLCVP